MRVGVRARVRARARVGVGVRARVRVRVRVSTVDGLSALPAARRASARSHSQAWGDN